MGSTIHFMAIVGVELDKEEFIRTETYADPWCQHMQAQAQVSLSQFCPECGKERPESRMRNYDDETLLPAAIQAAIAAELKDCEGEFHCIFENGPVKIAEGVELISVPNADRLFVGKELAMLCKESIEHRTFNIFECDPRKYAAKLRALGICREPMLHLFNFWW